MAAAISSGSPSICPKRFSSPACSASTNGPQYLEEMRSCSSLALIDQQNILLDRNENTVKKIQFHSGPIYQHSIFFINKTKRKYHTVNKKHCMYRVEKGE